MPGMAEHLEILLAVGADLMERFYAVHKELMTANFEKDHFIRDKVAKRLGDKFPQLVDALKEKDAGYEDFITNAHLIMKHFEPFFMLLRQVGEFRLRALELIHEMSNEIVKFDIELNGIIFSGYFNLMLQVAKLHILVGMVAKPAGRGKLALSAYAKAHAVMMQGRVPHEYEELAKYLLDYESPLPHLQDDFAKAKLRVADTLLPIAMQVVGFADPGHLRAEEVLSPLLTTRSAAKNAPVVDPLFARLPEAKQWLIYGLLMRPDELGEEAGAVDLLMALLSSTYALPVYGGEYIFPHSEFDADSKTLLKWLKRKDEVKRFQALLKDSRSTSYRHAGGVHAQLRAILSTKLSNLLSAILDAPSTLCARLPLVLSALGLAQEEIQWWVLHLDAVPEELPRKERDARDMNAFHPGSVQSLLRHTEALYRALTNDQRAVLAREVAQRMIDLRMFLEDLVRDVCGSGAMPHELAVMLRELPLHVAQGCDVTGVADLSGMRLNVLRISCELSRPSLYPTVVQNPQVASLLRQMHAAAELSLAIDTLEPLVARASEPVALNSDPAKLERLFASALETHPPDCLVMLLLAARAPSAAAMFSPLLARMSERIHSLLRHLCGHFGQQRVDPLNAMTVLDVSQSLCTLCKTLDRAPLLRIGASKELVDLQEWLHEQLEDFIEAHVAWVVFPEPAGLRPRAPTEALSLLADLSHALALIEPYFSLDAHAMLDAVIVRELGALEGVTPEEAASSLPPRMSQAQVGVLGVHADRAEGASVDADTLQRLRQRFLPAADGAQVSHAPTLISRLKAWIKREVEEAQKPGGPQYHPGRRHFEGSLLDTAHLSALCRLVGTSGMDLLSAVVLDAALESPPILHGVLSQHKGFFGDLAMTYERTRQLICQGEPLRAQHVPAELHHALAACREFGIALVVRSLVMAGTYEAKAELQPAAVASFVDGLGAQQLPDGSRARARLPEAMALLSSFGQVRSAEGDALLLQSITTKCGVDDEPTIWASLPYALALMLMLPNFDQAMWGLRLAEDALGGNAHCLVHAIHALLCMVEPHMPRGNAEAADAARSRGIAHRRFLEVASLVLLNKRRGLLEGGRPADVAHRERSLASVVLVVEQLVQHAEAVGYGDLQPFLPYSLVISSYSAVSQPVGDIAQGLASLAVDLSDSVKDGSASGRY